MPRNYYTNDEITLCTYAAIYDADDFGGREAICSLTGRPASSIPMKIRNIISTLDAKGIRRYNSMSGLTGRTTGDDARETNWEVIEPLARLSKQALLQRCFDIIG